MLALSRVLYGLVSVNFSGSVETQVRVVLRPTLVVEQHRAAARWR